MNKRGFTACSAPRTYCLCQMQPCAHLMPEGCLPQAFLCQLAYPLSTGTLCLGCNRCRGTEVRALKCVYSLVTRTNMFCLWNRQSNLHRSMNKIIDPNTLTVCAKMAFSFLYLGAPICQEVHDHTYPFDRGVGGRGCNLSYPPFPNPPPPPPPPRHPRLFSTPPPPKKKKKTEETRFLGVYPLTPT